MTALVIAAHGTRIEEGQQQCRALIDRVRRMLPDVRVLDCYVELDEPTIADAVTDALETDADKSAVVVPLMIGTGSHVEEDIPEGFGAGIETVAGSRVTYAPHLGPDPRMISAVCQRISAAAGDWSDDEISVVFLGRGTSLTTPNADHARLGRVLLEKGGYADLTNAYIQVTHPNLTEGLQHAYDKGGRKIVVMPHFLFHGRLENWTHKQANEWVAAHPDAEVRVADVIGDCDELAQVVVDRFRDASGKLSDHGAPQVYLAGLVLAGRKVVLAGGGHVAARRIEKLIDSGADITVVAPSFDERIKSLGELGKLKLVEREVTEADLDDAWYAMALTNKPEVNEQVAAWAEARRVFCVRGDDASGGTAWTPATGAANGLLVGVVGGQDPHRTAHARTASVATIRREF